MAGLVAVVVIVFGATAVGWITHHRLIRRRCDDGPHVVAEGLPVGDLAVPLLTLVALLVAFVLLQTFASFRAASDSAGQEAGALMAEADAAALLPPTVGPFLVGSLRCYARAVAGPGWESLAATRRTSPITFEANAQVQAALVAAGEVADEAVLTNLLAADRERIEARRRRLSEAEASVPVAVTVLMVFSVAVLLGGMAALTDRRVRPVVGVSLLVANALVFSATLAVILDLDRPFGGLARIEPTQMEEVERFIGELPYGADAPCDDRGRPR